MAAGLNDKFRKVGASTVTTLAAPGKALAASSINVGSTTNYPTDTGLVIAIRRVDTDGELVAGTYTEWNAIVSSATSFTISTTPRLGSDQVYPAGSTTQVFLVVSSSAQNDLIDGILVHADQDGTLKDGAVDTAAVLASNVVTTAKILDSNVTTAKLADSSVTYTKVAAGMPVQMVSSGFSSVATGTATIPQDDTAPQITEGTEFMTLSITPKSATNILVIKAEAQIGCDTAGRNIIGALFQDATANAIAANIEYNDNASTTIPTIISVTASITAGTTSATTIRFRAGAQAAATLTFNGNNSLRLFGTTPKSSITITEYKV